MTGAWARACDAKDVSDEDHALWAAVAITQGMAWEKVECVGGMWNLEIAGAHIRAWRQSLPDQGERRCDMTGTRTWRLLWIALQDVGRAQFWTAKDPSIAAFNLRGAEAALRTWWKRSQP